jgi:small-conductance mechanosensitive channel
MVEWMTFEGSLWVRDLVVSIIFLAIVVALRTLLVRFAPRAEGISLETTRRWMVYIRNGTLLVALLGLVMIWAHELQTLAISLVAVAAAIVIATREFILCFSGGVWRAVSNAYKIGDRIKIGDIRGDVVDINLLATTVMELGPASEPALYTGRAVTFPNSLLLSQPVADESYTGAYRVRIIRVPLPLSGDWGEARRRLLEIAAQECAEYLDAARAHMARMKSEEGFDTPTVEPRVAIELPEPGRVDLLLRVAVPAAQEGRITQAILARFLGQIHEHRPPGADRPVST